MWFAVESAEEQLVWKILDQVINIMPGDHLVALYSNEEEVTEYTEAFIYAALRRNDRCVYISRDADVPDLRRRIKAFDLPTVKRGDLVMLTTSEVYTKEPMFHPEHMLSKLQTLVEAALSDGFAGLSITGELNWAQDYPNGTNGVVEYEWRLNETVFDRFPISAMCRYDINKFSADMIINIIQLHPYVLWNSEIHENPYYIPHEGYKNNEINKYRVEGWLQNINKFADEKSRFRSELEKKETEMRRLHESMTNGIIMAMLEMLSTHDPYTKNHSYNVAVSARKLAEFMGLSDELVMKVYYAGLVHDIGKMLIQNNILNKHGKLTEEEYERVKKHPIHGANALELIDVLGDVSAAVRHHHERYDGLGYPQGLSGKRIPVMSRILSVCDSYDAMTNDRPYRDALERDQALSEIISCVGSQYDPEVARAFIKIQVNGG